MESISKCFAAAPPGEATDKSNAIIATTVVTTVALLSLARFSLWPRKPEIIRGPLTTSVPRLSEAERAAIPYQPDHFPGARDVETPYGNIRVYEFGPEDGRKVLFIHGISTSCMTLTHIAKPLAEKGCRVMLFDLFGRGYSDAPGDLPYDTRLFTTQILLVLASSPLAWTGDGALSLVGYSLGGGIAANFAAAFPRLVDTLILLAPSGLIRPENIGRASRLVFTSGLVPERLLAWLTHRRLRTPIDEAVAKRPRRHGGGATATATQEVKDKDKEKEKEDYIDVAVQEAVEAEADPAPTPFELQIASFVHWSLDHNAGFVPAMMSTIRSAPLMGQQQSWRRLARRGGPARTAVLLGEHDALVQRHDYEEDALPLLGGPANVFWRVLPGAHNFPFTHGEFAVQAIEEFWRQGEGAE
ncbi:Alpha/Beta hydrolase protein [Biscogniauxia mediterranea]|nr:Alpha/Beta hydrolase protein [Biscogniauxia mediterranea]